MGPEAFLPIFVTLFVIIDPPGIVPIYLALTSAMDKKQKSKAAIQATGLSLGMIALFAVVGQQIMNYMGIDVAALQASGGLLLLLVALQLLTGQADDPETANTSNIALVPLGTPLLAGPGAIVAVILFVNEAASTFEYLGIAIAIVAIHLIIFLVMRFSNLLVAVLRKGGIEVLTRISGMLLAGIAVQLIAEAVMTYGDQFMGR
ncbi:MarC family protein [Haloglycomyces albus]|uniref:MarC family protein n=1 Tax=Haloglycomyces albus TaxID=526067 RepID=UPI00046CCC05|nr:MarC family protein [Haloglycomyces albus]